LQERFTNQKASATARGRGLAGVTARSADGVAWWCTTEKFDGGSGGFEEVMVLSIDQVREHGRVKRMRNGAFTESTDSLQGQD